MTSPRPNLVKRIERLPKPINVASAMQPLFEAVSNSIHSTQERYKERVASDGRVIVTVNTSRNKDNVWATVEDNGYGLTEKNWEAFTTTDTDNKIEVGGKGVGRLIWLDCIRDIHVSSVYVNGDGGRHRRSFKFRLALEDQLENLVVEEADDAPDSSFFVKFSGLRDNGYRSNFPGRDTFVFQHLTSHFLPAFIGGRSPQVTVHVGDETRDYPNAISEIVHHNETPEPLESIEYGRLHLTLVECDKIASSDLKGRHFVHFIAHDRTVHSQCIDGKLGLTCFGNMGDRVFHAILTGDYLDRNVN